MLAEVHDYGMQARAVSVRVDRESVRCTHRLRAGLTNGAALRLDSRCFRLPCAHLAGPADSVHAATSGMGAEKRQSLGSALWKVFDCARRQLSNPAWTTWTMLLRTAYKTRSLTEWSWSLRIMLER